jgi:hypothetical protein
MADNLLHELVRQTHRDILAELAKLHDEIRDVRTVLEGLMQPLVVVNPPLKPHELTDA